MRLWNGPPPGTQDSSGRSGRWDSKPRWCGSSVNWGRRTNMAGGGAAWRYAAFQAEYSYVSGRFGKPGRRMGGSPARQPHRRAAQGRGPDWKCRAGGIRRIFKMGLRFRQGPGGAGRKKLPDLVYRSGSHAFPKFLAADTGGRGRIGAKAAAGPLSFSMRLAQVPTRFVRADVSLLLIS